MNRQTLQLKSEFCHARNHKIRDELKAVSTGTVINGALCNDLTRVFSASKYASFIEHESLKAKIMLCPAAAFFKLGIRNRNLTEYIYKF